MPQIFRIGPYSIYFWSIEEWLNRFGEISYYI